MILWSSIHMQDMEGRSLLIKLQEKFQLKDQLKDQLKKTVIILPLVREIWPTWRKEVASTICEKQIIKSKFKIKSLIS